MIYFYFLEQLQFQCCKPFVIRYNCGATQFVYEHVVILLQAIVYQLIFCKENMIYAACHEKFGGEFSRV